MSLKQNIIYLYFKGKHLITSKSQYQYNHGQYLYFADLNLSQPFEVHFSNKQRGESKTQIGSNKLVEIPDEYFWSGALEIYAWIYLHSGADDGETIYEVKIPLIKRAKPTDEEPLPVQQSAIDKAIAELNNAVDITNENADKTNADKTQVATIKEEVVTLKEEIDSTASTVSQDAQSARESADASEQSAQNSAESERKALDYSDEAKGYAQSALESKDTASQKAQVATDASAEAKGYRDEAETFKNEAEQAKQNIVDYRDETKGYRDETLNLKNTVQTLKNQVDETAEEIKGISDTVKEDAQNASQSASSANQSSINASQSASQAEKSANDAEESANQAEQNKSQTETFKNQSEEYKTQAGAFKSQTETFKNQAEEFKNQTETNVTHYPKIIGEYWYVWDATNGEYINTNVDANGIKGDTGRGIASIALNDDYTLTITFTDDTTYTTSSIRGQQGEKGDTGRTGESGVYIGTEEPENEDIKVWIDTDDDGTSEDLVKSIESLKENIYKPYVVDTASGSIASFTDGADNIPFKSLVVDINPVQDLHGYDSPWVAGGGKNLCPPLPSQTVNGITITTDANGVSHISGTVTATKDFIIELPSPINGTFTLSANNSVALSGTNTYFGLLDSNNNSLGDSTLIYANRYKTVTGEIAKIKIRFQTGLEIPNGFTVALQLEEGSTATDYAPYENICPITGWMGANVNATGKNLLKMPSYEEIVSAPIVVSYRSVPIKLEPNTTYYLSTIFLNGYTAHGSGMTVLVANNPTGNNPWKAIAHSGREDGKLDGLITTNEDGMLYLRFNGVGYTSAKIDTLYANSKIQLEKGDSATSYEPFGRFIPINWETEAGTVYGGKLDVLRGVLSITKYAQDMSALTWVTRYTGTTHKAIYTELDYRYARRDATKIIAEKYALVGTISGAANLNKPDTKDVGLYSYSNSNSVSSNSLYAVVDVDGELPSGLVVYDITTPIEIQLTPHDVNSLLGVNNIFADTGDTEVEYRADTKLYINKKIAEALASLT